MRRSSFVLWLELYCLALVPVSAMQFSTVNRCKPLEIAPCHRLGYNQTRDMADFYPSMPSKELQQYIDTVDAIRCSPDALFFMCTVYSPVCFQQYTPRVLPCRSVCERVKQGCLPFVKIAGFSWPSELDCKGFPEYNTGVCIRPSAIVSSTSVKRSPSEDEITEKLLDAACPECKSSQHLKKYKQFKRASYVIEAVVKSRITIAKGKTKLIVNVLKVYKEGKTKISTGTKSLVSPTKCLCPEIEFDKTMIILGQEDKRRGKLLYDHRSIVSVSSKHLSKKLQKWAKRYRKHGGRKNERKRKQKT